jgi:Lon protease-like protein
MKLFVFPLGESVLHPGTSKPLNIFEPRYLRMIEDALTEKVPIAVAFVDRAVLPDVTLGQSVGMRLGAESFGSFEAGFDERVRRGLKLSFVRPVVGFGQPQVLERRMDATLLVNVPGEGKARLGQVLDDRRPYIVCEAEKITESYEIHADQALQYLGLQRRLAKWMGEHISDQKTRDHFVAALSGPLEVIGAATAFLITDPDMQQLVLEADDINEKINLVTGMLMSAQFS